MTARPTPRYYVLHGEDELARSEALKTLRNRLGPPELVALNTTTFEADNVSLAELKKVSCRFHYRITCKRADIEQLLVKGFTNHACVNRQGKLTPFPADIRQRINRIWQLL